MKTVKLTKFEADVIFDCLNEESVCHTFCYCGYKTDMCDKLTGDGKYRCKLQQAIEDIRNKLKGGEV